MTKYVTVKGKTTNRAYKVADVVSRFSRQKKFVPEMTYGHVFANKVTELAGDNVELDMTEEVLVALKRRKVISGRRMVNLIGQHQREVRG
ncbi:hypothetical protein LCGC14_2076190 [marine sediment metagenome]|uniref:Uncharacterized protein n=1 Tax=marine sediment metagenome TaxID=412755 RepID=A0A0F9HDZ8_9ZZZZ